MIQELVRDCGHGTGVSQRLPTGYRRWSETADRIQEMVRDCGQDAGDGERLQIGCRRW
ncbi:unnamed protein product [Staurois parvus]|uniref:Uncharacterized protein n=1 Tax=Staurois parvus TaxID=386267 RepID=A0ABN9FV40_9NEOB|nr:unnamed protein product [Staurois parvus]